MGCDVAQPALSWDSQMRHSQSQPIVRTSATDQCQFHLFGSHQMHEIHAYHRVNVLSTLNILHSSLAVDIHRKWMTKFKDFSMFCLFAIFFSRNPFGKNQDFLNEITWDFNGNTIFMFWLKQWLDEFTHKERNSEYQFEYGVAIFMRLLKIFNWIWHGDKTCRVVDSHGSKRERA